MKTAYSFLFCYRTSPEFQNSTGKIEIFDGSHWLSANENAKAYETGNPLPVSAMLQRTFGLLPVSGDGRDALKRFLARKQVFMTGIDLPIRELEALGWETMVYPKKYLPVDGNLAQALLEDARKTGLDIDAGNEISCLTGPVFKRMADLLIKHGVPLRLYLDSGTMHWLEVSGAAQTHAWLTEIKNHPSAMCTVIESPEGCPADSLILSHSDKHGSHICSQDCLDDYDLVYENIVLRGAERGWPRIHKMQLKGNVVGLPDFGLWAEVSAA